MPAAHSSNVHTSPSSVHAEPSGSAPRQLSATSLHVSEQSASPSGPTHGSPLLMVHAPPEPVSGPVQTRPSSHAELLFGWSHTPAPSHWSSVQTLPSSVHGVPESLSGCTQAPEPLHWSSVHSLPSSVQAVPEVLFGC